MFHTSVRDQVLRFSCESWCDFVKKFTVPLEGDSNIWRVNDFPLLVMNMEVNLNFKRKKEKTKKKKDEVEEEGDKEADEPIKYEPTH